MILITHHISEVMRFAKHVTVLRKGRCINTMDTSEIGADELASLMMEFDEATIVSAPRRHEKDSLLSLRGVSIPASNKYRALNDINLTIRSGEILGVAGVVGSGQTELGRLIAGLLKPSAGSMEWTGLQTLTVPGKLASYIPCDQKHAVAPALSVAKNSFLKRADDHKSYALGFLKQSLMNQHASQLIKSFDIRPPLPDIPSSALSGGNLQRLIVARELATKSRIIVADNPSAGLDAAMAMRVRQELRKAADELRAVVLISPDMEELIAVSDRIVVMFNGGINGERQAGELDSLSLGLLMGGVEPDIVDSIRHKQTRALSDKRVVEAISRLSHSPYAWQRQLAFKIEQMYKAQVSDA